MANSGDYKKLNNKWLNKTHTIGSPELDALIDTVTNTGTPKDFYAEVQKGNVPGSAIVIVDATNEQLSTAEEDDIWGFESSMIYPVAEEQWEVVSSSANDTAAGTGARQVLISYLDGSYNAQSEIVTLNGTTAVPTIAVNMFRPTSTPTQEVKVVLAGSTGKNEGDIIIRAVGGGANRGFIKTSRNAARDTHYTSPAGKTSFLISAIMSTHKGNDVIMTSLRTNGEDGLFVSGIPVGSYQNTNIISGIAPPVLPEKSDYKVTGISENPNTLASITIQFLVVDL
jgi:hypothetical protein